MPDLSIFKIDSQTINIKDTTARQTADSAKTLATTASGNATTALNKINKLESEKADKTLATASANGLMSAADKSKLDGIGAGSNVKSVNSKTGAVTLTKSDIGLGNVDNTADSAKSVKYAASAGSANAVAWGNVSGKPSTYPPSSHTHTPAQVGLGNVANDLDAALNKINELEKLSRVSISYDSTKENMTITIGTHSVA